MLRIFHNTRYEFIKHWRMAAILTAAFIAAGLASFAVTGGAFNDGVHPQVKQIVFK